MPRTRWLLAIVATAAVAIAFLAGRWSVLAGAPVPTSARPSGSQRPVAEIPGSRTAPGSGPAREAAPGGSASVPPTSGDAGTGPGPTTLAACVQQLGALREAAAAADAERIAAQGAPTPPPAADAEPRFRTGALEGAVTRAFGQAKVAGGVDGADCSEYPCIVFGRINGTEDAVEPLERARAFDVYDDDISNILLWAQTDEAAEEAAERRGRRDLHAEQTLFAIAFYSHADAAARGDDLDRRIRWRVTEHWNAINPSDESGASRPP